MSQNKSSQGNPLLAFILLMIAIFVVVIVSRLTAPRQQIFFDDDGDGYFTIANEGKAPDCDDSNAEIYPNAPEIEGDSIDQDCDGFDKLPEFDPEDYRDEYVQFDEFIDSKESGRYVPLYDDSPTPRTINNKTIAGLSRRVQTSGKFKKAYLYVSAGAGEDQRLIRGESVYFYVDTGDTGGHLIKSKSLNIDGEKAPSEYSNFLYKVSNLALTSLPYREESTPEIRKINLLEVLNSENHGYDRKHYIGAFVSSNRTKAKIFEMGVAYECEAGAPCDIEIIK